MAISLGVYPIFRHTHILFIYCLYTIYSYYSSNILRISLLIIYIYIVHYIYILYRSKLFQNPAAPRGECGLLGEVPLRQGCRSTGNPRFNGKIIDQNGGDVFIYTYVYIYIYICIYIMGVMFIHTYIYNYTYVCICLWIFMDFPCLMTRDDNGWHQPYQQPSIQHRFC